jgi:hypothetical protein
MKYIITFWKYCVALLPPRLRRARIQDLLRAFTKALQTVNDNFIAFVQQTFYKVSFTGQVVYLEHILNDRYDNALRRIYIADGLALPLPPYLYNKVEERPLTIFNKAEGEPTQVYLRNKVEYESENDFIVYVPNDILNPALEKSIRSLVRVYKIAGKRFSVIGF